MKNDFSCSFSSKILNIDWISHSSETLLSPFNSAISLHGWLHASIYGHVYVSYRSSLIIVHWMYATEGPFCPVASFEKYLQHLNPQNVSTSKEDYDGRFWCLVWQHGRRRKILYLGDMMKNISKQAGLSKQYTNHSIRATAVTILDKSGFGARHIMSVSGHRSESSIRSYIARWTKLQRSESQKSWHLQLQVPATFQLWCMTNR
jgi:hypothetical protein